MIEAYRIVESQSQIYSYLTTSSAENAEYIESFLEETKPARPNDEWHMLLVSPFRYPLPVPPMYQARFRPPFYARNVLYCSEKVPTALHEHAYHFLKERIHLDGVKEAGERTVFSLFIHDGDIIDIRTHPDINAIMDKRDYAKSHSYIHSNPDTKVLCYPSCREPEKGPNYAAFEISSLEKVIGTEKLMSFYFDQRTQSITWKVTWDDFNLKISWGDVAG